MPVDEAAQTSPVDVPIERRRADPTLAGLFARQLDEAAEQRREMTAAVSKLGDAMTAHNADAERRSGTLLAALASRDAGAAKAIEGVAQEKTAVRVWKQTALASVAREFWGVSKVPIGVFLAYWGARYSGVLPVGMQPPSAQASVPVSIVASPLEDAPAP